MSDAPGRALARATARLAAVDEAADPRRAAVLWEAMAHELRLAGQGEESFAALDRALRVLAGADGAGPDRAELRERYARVLLDHGRHAAAVTMAEAALAELGDGAVHARATLTLGFGRAALGATDEGVDLMRAAVLGGEHRDVAVGVLADALARLGHPGDGLALLRTGRRPGDGLRPTLLEGDLLLALGRPAEAERALDPSSGGSLHELRLRARLAVLRGQWAFAGRLLDSFAERCDITPAPRWLEPLHGLRALTALHEGRIGHARETVAAGLTALQGSDDGTRPLRLVWTGLRVEAEAAARAAAAGEPFDAWTLRGLETELAYTEGAAARWAEAAPTAALARAEIGRVAMVLDEAGADPAAWLEPAAAFSRLGLAWPAAYARVRAGEALLSAGQDAAAREVLTAASAAATRMEAGPLLDAIRALREQRSPVTRAG